MSEGLLPSLWSIETTADPVGWSPDNPAWGQCAVTALVVQDLLGGDLLRSTVLGVSHYWNRVRGFEIDLTLHQFDPSARRIGLAEAAYDRPPVVRDREYVLGFPDTKVRYEILCSRLADRLWVAPWDPDTCRCPSGGHTCGLPNDEDGS